jgi:hypothetical protein
MSNLYQSQSYGPPPYGQPVRPVPPRQNNGLAIVALVLSGIAVTVVLVGFVSQMMFGLVFGGLMTAFGDSGPMAGGLTGTAPQVVSGQQYPGRLLADEVTRVMSDDYGLDVTQLSCPETPEVVADAVTVCQGVADSGEWSFKVTFKDGLGHFALDQKAN